MAHASGLGRVCRKVLNNDIIHVVQKLNDNFSVWQKNCKNNISAPWELTLLFEKYIV